MSNLRYLGTNQIQFGATLMLLVYEIMPHDEAKNLTDLWAFIKAVQHRDEEQHKFRYLNRPSMFKRKSGAHKLRSKGAESKGFTKALLEAWLHFAPQDTQVHKKITLMLKLNLQMENILQAYRTEMLLPQKEAEQFKLATFGMCQLQLQIHEHFKARGSQNLFNVTPKCHFLCHIATFSSTISPRRVWCFLGEDQMRRVATVARACSRRVASTQVTVKMLRRIRISLQLLYDKV